MTTFTAMPKYEAYKESGAEWLGVIPDEWDVLSVKHIYRLIVNPAPKNNDYELLSVYSDIGVKPRAELEERGNKASTTDGYFMVKKGDLVVNKLLAWMGALGISDYDGVTSPAYDVLRPQININNKFFHYLFRMPSCMSELRKHSRGIMDMRLRLYFDKFGYVKVPYPKVDIQNKIVQFLDEKAAKIDEAIAIKEKQIELLKERKQIIIQQAVTQGLDPTAPMKDSGVEWIGKIPAHWEVKKIKFIFDKVRTGTTPSTANQNYFDGEINWFGPKDMNSSTLIFSERKISELAIKKGEAFLFPADSVLVVGIGATSGKTSYLNEAASFNQQVTGFHSEQIVNKYMYYVISSMSMMMLGLANYTTLPILNNEFFKNFILPVPSNAEQIDIINFIESEFVSINKMSMYLDMQIEKLKEYKTTLINSAVTGKIKVV